MQAGVLDLSAWDFEAAGTVLVTGDWLICWGEFVAADSEDCPRGRWETFPAPRLWSDSSVSSPIGGTGIASYRATIELPPGAGDLALRVGAPLTAYRIWINGEDRGGAGTIGRTPSTTVATLANRIYTLPRGISRLDLRVQVANFEFRGGGLRREWYVGPVEQVRARASYELLLYAVFATACAVIGIVFLLQFALRRSERARGWFGLFALLVGLRILPGSSGDLYQLSLGWASFDLLIRLEYMNTALLIAVGLAYLREKVPGVMPPRLTQILMLAALALVPIHLLAPLETVLATLPVILALPPLASVVSIASYGRAARRGQPGAAPTLAVSLVFAVGIVHDVVRTQTGLGAPIELFPYCVVAFIASEAHSLLQSFARSFSTAERLAAELEDTNFELRETEQAVVRFVPFDFLRTLGKQSIRDVGPGDHVEAEMSVLFCGPLPGAPATFTAVNDWLRRVEPPIRANQGFVIQQFADGIVGLFPRGAGDALSAALAIRREVHSSGDAVPLCIAIATGKVTTGTVGDGESLAGVAVGAPVDLVRRLHDLARSTRAEVVISDATRRALGSACRHEFRACGSIELAGSVEPTPVFELVDGSG